MRHLVITLVRQGRLRAVKFAFLYSDFNWAPFDGRFYHVVVLKKTGVLNDTTFQQLGVVLVIKRAVY